MVPISEIKKHTVISVLLQKVNTQLMVHLWNEDDIQISVLGFHVGVNPSNFLKAHFEEDVCKKINKATGKSLNKIPKFQCGITSLFLINRNGNCTLTRSYDVQC